MHETDPTKRFTGRVPGYAVFRPDYPDGTIELIADATGLQPGHHVADVGSGTGILTRRLLAYGNRVVAVEPNAEMRAVAEHDLSEYEGFVSVDATAENTGLGDGSVDLVCAAQAFHWFDPVAARREFARILRGGKWVVLLWNTRRVEATPFMRDYERLLVERAVDYTDVDHTRVDETRLRAFFSEYTRHAIPFTEALSYQVSLGRMLSASYVAAPGQPGHDSIVAGFRAAFERHQRGGRVGWVYETEIYTGRLG
jgi:SAM-dependent methyltransferase